MKNYNSFNLKNIHFLIALCFVTSVLRGQTSITSSGISVQGIAKDVDGNSFANISGLSIDFYLYYLDSNNAKVTILAKDDQLVTTDAFGVFSYVLDVPKTIFSWFEQTSIYLFVGEGTPSSSSAIFLEQKLGAVPYAIYAQNGAPTGIILPFVGAANDVPPGWVLCDGSSLPSSSIYDDLRAFVGSNVPDLRGVFLRATGDASSSNSGPGLRNFQDDVLIEHNHSINLTSTTAGSHSHQLAVGACCQGNNSGTFYPQTDNRNYNGPSGFPVAEDFTVSSGNHTHNVSGNTSNLGDNETRPANYGVNYIIKI